MSNLTLQTELRHLNQQQRRKIEDHLNANGYEPLKDLIAIIPKELDSLEEKEAEDKRVELLINREKYIKLENQKSLKNGSPSKAFLDYWSTFEIQRPTIEHLIYYSAKCNLYKLVQYLVDQLKINNLDVELRPKTKEFLINNCKFLFKQIDEINEFKESSKKDKPIEENNSKDDFKLDCEKLGNIRTIDLNLIRMHTNDFNENDLKHGGNKLGEGGFGTVFLAKIPKNELNEDLNCELDHTGKNYLIAVKVVSNEFRNQYLNEFKCLTEFKHPNLLNMIGLSYYRNTMCILSEYMINGSLENCLLQTNIKPIDWEQRIKIIKQIISAIYHLHTFKKGPLIHRDIKTSNILLDRNFNAKLCDFGLARLNSLTGKTINTFNIIGTSVYMAPEAFKGIVSEKIDTFSFGIVLLEILTGLPPIDEENEEYPDILSYISEYVFEALEEDEDQEKYEQKIKNYLDKKAGDWDLNIAIQLLDLARKATNYDKIKRPTMKKVKELFEQIVKL